MKVNIQKVTHSYNITNSSYIVDNNQCVNDASYFESYVTLSGI